MKLIDQLKKMGACKDALDWIGDRDLSEAWAECQRADWMLWLAERAVEGKYCVKVACLCARTALKYVPEGEDRPRLAIEAAERWIDNPSSDAAAHAAARAADAAAHAADAAADAADAAAHAGMADIVRSVITIDMIYFYDLFPGGRP